MLEANNNSDAYSSPVPVPTSFLTEQSELVHTDSTVVAELAQGVICNDFSFPLLYHADVLPPFTCSLFFNNTFVDSLPFPSDNTSDPLSLAYIRYYLNYYLEFRAIKDNVLYSTPPIGNFSSHPQGAWFINYDHPKTASPLIVLNVHEYFSICTSRSCTNILFSNNNSVGFLLQSPPPGQPTRCPQDSSSVWIDSIEQCITPQPSLPEASLVPYFVPFTSSHNNHNIYFLESASYPPSDFRLTVQADISVEGNSSTRNIKGNFLLIGLTQSSIVVNNFHVHDLHSLFPIVLPQLQVIRIKNLKAILQGDTNVTFHTPANSYGIVEDEDPTGQRSLSLAPLQILQSETYNLTGINDVQNWSEMMESLQNLGMEVTQIYPSLPSQEQVTSTEEHATVSGNSARNTGREIIRTKLRGNQGSQGTVGVQRADMRHREQLLKKNEDTEISSVNKNSSQQVTPEKTVGNESAAGRSGNAKPNPSASHLMEFPSNDKAPDTNQTHSEDQKQSPGQVSSGQVGSKNLLEKIRKEVASDLIKLRQKDKGQEKPKEKPFEGVGYYILAVLLVMALIWFFCFRRRVRRVRKEEKKEENSPSEELLHTTAV